MDNMTIRKKNFFFLEADFLKVGRGRENFFFVFEAEKEKNWFLQSEF